MRTGGGVRGAKVRKVEISDPETGDRLLDARLIEYAVTARVDRLVDLMRERERDEPTPGGYSKRANFADRLEMTPSNFSQSLPKAGLPKLASAVFVEKLQRLLTIEETRWGMEAGDLVTFRDNVLRQHGSDGIRVPADYFRRLTPAGAPPRSVEELLVWVASMAAIRAEALEPDDAETLRQFADAEDDGGPGRVERVLDELLVTIGTASGERTAAVSLAAELKEWVLPAVAYHLKNSPVGWRAALVLTRMLTVHQGGKHRTELLRQGVEKVLEGATRSESPTVDPARCFIEEAMRRSPGGPRESALSPRSFRWGWVPDRLVATATNTGAPVRQRAFAALVLAEREETAAAAAEVLDRFRAEQQASDGLEHASLVLERFLADPAGQITRQHWLDSTAYSFIRPFLDSEEQSLDAVASGPRYQTAWRKLPYSVVDATPVLIEHGLLNIDVSIRRRVCDTVIAAGLTAPVAERITEIIRVSDCPKGVQDVGAVVLGYLGDPVAIEVLIGLTGDKRQDQMVRNAALMALGDMRSDPESKARQHLEKALSGKGDRRTKSMAAYGLINQARSHPERLGALGSVFSEVDESREDMLTWLSRWARSCASAKRLVVPEPDLVRL